MTDTSPANPWAYCQCGHPWIHHDVEEMGDPNPTCCVTDCTQNCAQRQPGSPIPNPKTSP